MLPRRVRRDDVIVPLTRNPFEVLIFALCVLSAVQAPAVHAAHLPQWVAVPWHGLLLFGGVTGLVGLYWPDAITGLLIVRAAMMPVGFGAYAWAATSVAAHITGVVGGLVIAGFGLAAHRRAWNITQSLHTTRPQP